MAHDRIEEGDTVTVIAWNEVPRSLHRSEGKVVYADRRNGIYLVHIPGINAEDNHSRDKGKPSHRSMAGDPIKRVSLAAAIVAMTQIRNIRDQINNNKNYNSHRRLLCDADSVIWNESKNLMELYTHGTALITSSSQSLWRGPDLEILQYDRRNVYFFVEHELEK